jgi:hypothetical protein
MEVAKNNRLKLSPNIHIADDLKYGDKKITNENKKILKFCDLNFSLNIKKNKKGKILEIRIYIIFIWIIFSVNEYKYDIKI